MLTSAALSSSHMYSKCALRYRQELSINDDSAKGLKVRPTKHVGQLNIVLGQFAEGTVEASE